MTSPVRFGILGCGRIAGKAFAPALARSSAATLEAAASRDVARARQLDPRRSYGSYDALLLDPDVDAVYVATHNGLHKELTLKALAAGKHVLCEKPLASDARECEEMIAAAETHDRVLVEAFMYRSHPRIRRALELVRSGAIGELMTVDTAFSFKLSRPDDVRLKRAFGGGALLDVGCYCVNLCRLFLGDEPRRVRALGAFHPQHDVDMSLHGVLEYTGGRFGVISCGFDGGLRNDAVLSGTGGTLAIPEVFLPRVSNPVLVLETSSGVTQESFDPLDVYQQEIEDMVVAIRGGPRHLGPREGLHNARIMDALLEDARRVPKDPISRRSGGHA